MYRGSRVRVKHTTSHLSWKRMGSSSSAALACGCMPSGNKRERLQPSCHHFCSSALQLHASVHLLPWLHASKAFGFESSTYF